MAKFQNEEKRKTLQIENELQKEKSRYDDRLAKERILYRLNQEKALNEENLKKQEESVKRQEAIRRATLDYEHHLKVEQEKERLINKYKIKNEIEKQNFDLTEKKIRVLESEKRQTNKEVTQMSLGMIGQGFKEFLTNKSLFFRLVSGFTIAYLGGYSIKSAISMIHKSISLRMVTPKLIRETSKIPLSQFFRYPWKYLTKYRNSKKENLLEGIILNKDLNNQVTAISESISNRKLHYAPFRNLLFHGPPGTGKTLFAKRLAEKCGFHYAILTGADVAPLGPNAVDELHRIFDWAETNRRGRNSLIKV